MTALTSLLVRDQRVSVRQIEEVIQKQVIRGGALEEVLLDLEVVPENVLCAYQAVLAGMVPVDRDEVMAVPPAMLHRVPRELAIKEQLIPLREEGGELVLAVCRARSPDEQKSLVDQIGAPLAFRFVTAPRLSAALFAHYDADVPTGLLPLLEALEKREAGELPYVRPPGGSATVSGSPGPIEPAGAESKAPAGEQSPAPTPETRSELVPQSLPEPTPETVPESEAESRRRRNAAPTKPDLPASRPPPSQAPAHKIPSRRVRGALTPRRALEELQIAQNRDQVLEVVLLFARQYFDYTAVLAVRGDELQVLNALSEAGGAADVSGVRIPASSAARFATVGNLPSAAVVDTASGAHGTSLAEYLGRAQQQPALVAPVTLRGRTVLVLYGDRSGERFSISDVPELVALLPRVGEAFQRIIVNKKKQVGYVPAGTSRPSQKPKLVTRPEGPEAPAPKTQAGNYRAASARPERSGRVSKDTLWQLAAERSAPPPPASNAPAAGPGANAQALKSKGENVELTPGHRARRPPKDDPGSTMYKMSDVPVEVVRRGSADAAPARGRPARRRRPSVPPPTASAGSPLRDPADASGPQTAYRSERGLPPAASLRRSPSSPRPSAPVPGAIEPNVIVAMGESFEVPVDQLLRSDPDTCAREIERLLEIGEAAIPALIQQFPGPLWFDRRRRRPPFPWGGDVSAVARALLAFGSTAAPYVASLMRKDDADIRFYATLVAAHIRAAEVVPELAQRVFDSDKQTQAVAIAALPNFDNFPAEMRAALEFFRLKARATTHAPAVRMAALSALGSCRDTRSLPILVDILGSEQESLARAAYDALVSITCQDFGGSQADWGSWLRRNQGRHRIEWLIDSLNHPDAYLRAQACEDLKELTQEYFGYIPNAPARDREVSQRKYRTWWDQEGRFRFQAPQ